MKEAPTIMKDVRTIRDVEDALESVEDFVGKIKNQNKIKLTIDQGQVTMTREEINKLTDLVVTLERSGKALETAVRSLRDMMTYDEVTQMFSRRYIFHLVENELYRATRYDNHFSVIALELDPVTNGDGDSLPAHLGIEDMNLLVGEAARVIRKYVRDSDSPGRTSDRTFMVLLPETDAKGALILAERIRKALDKKYDLSIGKVPMTVSGAIIESQDPAVEDMAGLLYVMDQKLGEARQKGPNVIIK